MSAVTITVALRTGSNPFVGAILLGLIYFLVQGFVSDYIALLKTRIIIRRKISIVFLLPLDIILSLAISLIFFALLDYFLIIFYYHYADSILEVAKVSNIIESALEYNLSELTKPTGSTFPPIFFISTLFTSIWTILIVFSTVALRLLSPIQHLTTWFFDVERHPVQAIGIVAGALVITASFLWKLV